MADPVDEYAVHQLQESNGSKPKPTTKEGLDLGDQDEKKTLEELKIEPEPLRKLMKEALGDKVEEAIVNDRAVDTLHALTMSEHGLSADMERIMKAQAPRDNSMHFASGSQQQLQAARQERERKQGKKRVRRFREKSGRQLLGREGRKKKRERKRDRREQLGAQEGEKGEGDQEGRKEDEEEEAEEGGGEQVEKDVTGWTVVTRNKRQKKMIQIFAKVDGSKVTPM